jgi:thiamine biosynthesis protein ThiS
MTIEGPHVAVNGTTRRIPEATTVASLATTLIGPAHSGIAIAVNGTVLPMASWATGPATATASTSSAQPVGGRPR